MGLHTYTRVVGGPLKQLITIAAASSLLAGCAGLMIGASAGNTAIDRYEKHHLEKRMDHLEKKLDQLKKQLDKEKK